MHGSFRMTIYSGNSTFFLFHVQPVKGWNRWRMEAVTETAAAWAVVQVPQVLLPDLVSIYQADNGNILSFLQFDVTLTKEIFLGEVLGFCLRFCARA